MIAKCKCRIAQTMNLRANLGVRFERGKRHAWLSILASLRAYLTPSVKSFLNYSNAVSFHNVLRDLGLMIKVADELQDRPQRE